MKILELTFNLALILVGGFFCISSLHLGLGKVNDPGPGLIPLGTGAMLILFSLAAIVESTLGKGEEQQPLLKNRRWPLVLGLLIFIFVYAVVLQTLGFLSATFLLLLGLFRASGVRSWKRAFTASLTTTGLAYLLFDTLFQCNFPKGVFGF
jgi:putative tricarboxylic transport membrane protein